MGKQIVYAKTVQICIQHSKYASGSNLFSIFKLNFRSFKELKWEFYHFVMQFICDNSIETHGPKIVNVRYSIEFD